MKFLGGWTATSAALVVCALAILAGLAAILFFLAAPMREVERGSKLADRIIALSQDGTRAVTASTFGGRFCLLPESVYPRPHVEAEFIGHKLEPPRPYQSEGVWFFAFVDPDLQEVAIVAIPQPRLRWNVPGSLTARVICPDAIKVAPGPVPEIKLNP